VIYTPFRSCLHADLDVDGCWWFAAPIQLAPLQCFSVSSLKAWQTQRGKVLAHLCKLWAIFRFIFAFSVCLGCRDCNRISEFQKEVRIVVAPLVTA
jgi:hypothetical protein